MKIYTKTGDGGETGLVDGSRVRKDHPRVAAFGDVDEVNAVVGVARTHADPELSALLEGVQRDLFAIGAQIADPRAQVASRKEKAALAAGRIVDLERAIDAHDARMPALTAFILPGGTPLAAALHVARTVCRRAERAVLGLGPADPVDPLIVVYLNRLSDLLFVLARHANQAAGRAEAKW
jgi:cob(I)alamin adenosyltransferase